MNVHTCPECCPVMSYVETTLQHDYREYGAHVQWWRHPLWCFLVRPRIREYAAALLDESGK